MRKLLRKIVSLCLVLTLALLPCTLAEAPSTPAGDSPLSDVQRSSLLMLNYLTVLTQEINSSRNSRLVLEDVYSLLLNYINPSAVDEATQDQIDGMLDTLQSFRMIDVKRERLQRVQEDWQAQSLEELLPIPFDLAALKDHKNGPLIGTAVSIASTATNALLIRSGFLTDRELEYLQDGWELDDEEASTLHASRKSAFDYMVQTVNEQGLPDELALNEISVEEFVDWKNNDNVVARIQFLESNRTTYQALGEYWLLLARSYYEHGDYADCLAAVSAYEGLGIRIFRRDRDLAQVLPLAISAAAQSLEEDQYLPLAERYADMIVRNTGNDEWALRYYAAQVYAQLYAMTGEEQHLTNAYQLSLNNVNTLVNRQRSRNDEYLSPVEELDIPKELPDEKKEEIKACNKQLKEERKTALPPVDDALLLNCDLLFLCAEEMDISEADRAVIDGILYEGDAPLFLNPSLDEQYRASTPGASASAEETGIEFDGASCTLPVRDVTEDVTLTMEVTGPDGETVQFDDWEIESVERKKGTELEEWTVTFRSPGAKEYEYTEDTEVRLTVSPWKGTSVPSLRFGFSAYNDREDWWDKAKIWDDGISFQRL